MNERGLEGGLMTSSFRTRIIGDVQTARLPRLSMTGDGGGIMTVKTSRPPVQKRHFPPGVASEAAFFVSGRRRRGRTFTGRGNTRVRGKDDNPAPQAWANDAPPSSAVPRTSSSSRVRSHTLGRINKLKNSILARFHDGRTGTANEFLEVELELALRVRDLEIELEAVKELKKRYVKLYVLANAEAEDADVSDDPDGMRPTSHSCPRHLGVNIHNLDNRIAFLARAVQMLIDRVVDDEQWLGGVGDIVATEKQSIATATAQAAAALALQKAKEETEKPAKMVSNVNPINVMSDVALFTHKLRRNRSEESGQRGPTLNDIYRSSARANELRCFEIKQLADLVLSVSVSLRSGDPFVAGWNMDSMVMEVCRYLQCHGGALYLLDDHSASETRKDGKEGEKNKKNAKLLWTRTMLGNERTFKLSGIVGKVAKSGEPLCHQDVTQVPEFDWDSDMSRISFGMNNEPVPPENLEYRKRRGEYYSVACVPAFFRPGEDDVYCGVNRGEKESAAQKLAQLSRSSKPQPPQLPAAAPTYSPSQARLLSPSTSRNSKELTPPTEQDLSASGTTKTPHVTGVLLLYRMHRGMDATPFSEPEMELLRYIVPVLVEVSMATRRYAVQCESARDLISDVNRARAIAALQRVFKTFGGPKADRVTAASSDVFDFSSSDPTAVLRAEEISSDTTMSSTRLLFGPQAITEGLPRAAGSRDVSIPPNLLGGLGRLLENNAEDLLDSPSIQLEEIRTTQTTREEAMLSLCFNDAVRIAIGGNSSAHVFLISDKPPKTGGHAMLYTIAPLVEAQSFGMESRSDLDLSMSLESLPEVGIGSAKKKKKKSRRKTSTFSGQPHLSMAGSSLGKGSTSGQGSVETSVDVSVSDPLFVANGLSFAKYSFPLESGYAIKRSIETKHSVVLPDVHVHHDYPAAVDWRLGINPRHVIVVPLFDHAGSVRGVCRIVRGIDELPFTDEDYSTAKQLTWAVAEAAVMLYRQSELRRAFVVAVQQRNKTRAKMRWRRSMDIVACNARRQSLAFRDFIVNQTDIPTLVHLIAEHAKRNLAFNAWSRVYLVDPSKQYLITLRRAQGYQRDAGLSFPITRGISGFVALSGEPRLVQDARSDPAFDLEVDCNVLLTAHSANMCVMCVPLTFGISMPPSVLGVLIVASNGQFTNLEFDAAKTIGMVGGASLGVALDLERRDKSVSYSEQLAQGSLNMSTSQTAIDPSLLVPHSSNVRASLAVNQAGKKKRRGKQASTTSDTIPDRSLSKSERIMEVTRILSSADITRLGTLIGRVSSLVADVLGCQYAIPYFIDINCESHKELFFRSSSGDMQAIDCREGLVGYVYQTGGLVNATNVSQDPRFRAVIDLAGTEDKDDTYAMSCLVVPMSTKSGTIVGTLLLLNKLKDKFLLEYREHEVKQQEAEKSPKGGIEIDGQDTTKKKNHEWKEKIRKNIADFSPEDEKWAQFICGHVASSVEDATLAVSDDVSIESLNLVSSMSQSLKDSRVSIQRLLHLQRSLSDVFDFNSLVITIMSKAKELVRCQRCTVYIANNTKNELQTIMAEGNKLFTVKKGQGIAGRVYETARSFMTDNAYKCAYFDPTQDRSTGFITRSVLAVPILSEGGTVLGVIQVINKLGVGQDKAFAAVDYDRLAPFVPSCAAAIVKYAVFRDICVQLEGIVKDYMRMHAKLRWKAATVEVVKNAMNTKCEVVTTWNRQSLHKAQMKQTHTEDILNALHSVNQQTTTETLAKTICASACKIVECERACLFLRDVDMSVFVCKRQWASPANQEDVRLPQGVSVVGMCAEEGRIQNVGDPEHDPRFTHQSSFGFTMRSVVCVPIFEEIAEEFVQDRPDPGDNPDAAPDAVATKAGKRVIGVLQLVNRHAHSDGGTSTDDSYWFTSTDEELMKLMVPHVAIAIARTKTLENLIRERNCTRSILSTIPSTIAAFDMSGHLSFANRPENMLKTFGFDENRMRYVAARDWLMVHDNRQFAVDFRDVLTHGRSVIRKRGIYNQPTSMKIILQYSLIPLKNTDEDSAGILFESSLMSGSRRTRDVLSRKFPNPIVDRLELEAARLQGAHIDGYIVVVRLVDAVPLTQRLKPKDGAGMLNQYYQAVTDVILEHDGIIDRMTTDVVVAVFGIPYSTGKDDGLRAVTAALAIQDAIKKTNELNEQRRIAYQEMLREKRRQKEEDGEVDEEEIKRLEVEMPHIPEMRVTVAVHSDSFLVGIFGPTWQADYTLVGDAIRQGQLVATAAELIYGVSVIITESVYHHVKSFFVTRQVDMVVLSTMRDKHRLYEVVAATTMDLTPIVSSMLTKYQEALLLYKGAGYWDAHEMFRAVLRSVPNDGPSTLYMKRCISWHRAPPSASDRWDVCDLEDLVRYHKLEAETRNVPSEWLEKSYRWSDRIRNDQFAAVSANPDAETHAQ
eukprot:Rmarinus@m.26157